MAFSLVGNAAAQRSGASAVTSAIDTTGADLIVLVTAYYPDTQTVTDSKGNSWTALTAHEDSSITGCRIYYCLNPTVGTGHTFTFTNLYAFIMASAWSGANTSSSFDQQNGSTGSAVPLNTGSITPSEDNELVIAGFGCFYKNYTSVDAGFTALDSANYIGGVAMGGAHAYKIQTSASAVNPGFTSGAGGYAGAVIASFKSASAPPAAVKLLTLLGVG